MNTQRRLRDALTAVGDTLGPRDVPELRLPPERPRASRRAAPLAVAAALAAVTAGTFVAFAPAGGDGREPAARPSRTAASAPVHERNLSVFLCGRDSGNPACGRRDVTAAQRADVQRRLAALPEVRSVTFESAQQATERLRTRIAENPGTTASLQPGSVPAVFRVVLRAPERYAAVAAAIAALPGVDVIVPGHPLAVPRR
ncbi:permease-like cell division protein FtsX [Thermomonospora amylolytica]|uniref:permease-like cell division protein FtsX n=1 Tax=Thermomonospora amylolytica TaxID=1411117 RepID=UPI000E6D282F|nr:permease-like cell division protein FtsX [Thermomonospora amylolytica]